MKLRNAVRTVGLVALCIMAPALLSAQAHCGLQTLQASYAFYYTSGVPGTPSYGVGVGVVTFDGAGKATSTETVSVGGSIIPAVSSVTYTVKPNCTGTITWTYPDFGGLVVHADLVIADNGKTIYTIGTDSGSMSYGIYTRQ